MGEKAGVVGWKLYGQGSVGTQERLGHGSGRGGKRLIGKVG